MTGNGRRVIGSISMSLDGRVTGPGGETDMSWVARHATSNAARDHMVRAQTRATTAIMGRKNYEGFHSYWPPVASDPSADPRDRALAAWLNRVEKVVFSRTLAAAEWENSRIVAGDPAQVVAGLRAEGAGDIIVLNSVSLLRALLSADALDRLSIDLAPEISGGGTPLFVDGQPPASWSLVESVPTESGALCLTYDRLR